MTIQDAKELGMDAAAEFKHIPCPFSRQDKELYNAWFEGFNQYRFEFTVLKTRLMFRLYKKAKG